MQNVVREKGIVESSAIEFLIIENKIFIILDM